jgi:hypothetical protein
MGTIMQAEKPTIDLQTARNLFVEHRETIRQVFARAVQQALREHKRAGNPVAAAENGQVIWLAPEQIQTDQIA